MKKASLITLTLLIFLSCHWHHNKEWTDTYYKTMYNYIDNANKEIIKNDSQRKPLTDWEITKFKKELPDGFSSITKDSLDRFFRKLGHQYAKTHKLDNVHAKVPWTEYAESSFKEGLLSSDYVQKMDRKIRGKFCNCFLAEVKKIYPDTLITPVPDSVYVNTAQRCNDQIAGKKQ